MTPERWRQVTALFHDALARDAASRAAFLDEACAGDDGVRVEVERLLAAHVEAGDFGERPVAGAPGIRVGARLGNYRIEALLGAGGMGEVYRAEDLRLGRRVAIKVLHLGGDAARKERLVREARALAALSHPHICQVFDLGEHDGVDFIVMEHLEGELLADRLAKGPLPLDGALAIAMHIAAALDRAHRAGIVHRDLKPGNVMLARDGAKLLDFGLARRAPLPAAAPVRATGSTEQVPLTGPGAIVGTLQYMAPEQLHGEEADARTDIFALGAVIHEMVTGRRAFEGATQASLIAAIIERAPPAISSIVPIAPPPLDELVRTCLAKDRAKRWQSAGDVGRHLAWIAATLSAPSPSRRRGVGRVTALAALAAAIVGGGAALLLRPTPAVAPRPVSRFDHAVPDDQELRNVQAPVVALAPDGARFVYSTKGGLYLRSLRDFDARVIPGTEHEDLLHPFFSPDGKWIGFFAGGELKKIAATGGSAISLCKAGKPYGAHWGRDGRIVYGQEEGVFRVPAGGGTPEALVRAGAAERMYVSEVLPGGEWLLLSIARLREGPVWSEAVIVAQSLTSAERKPLWTGGTDARYLRTGHLVFFEHGSLHAVPLDLRSLEIAGEPVPLVRGVQRAFGTATYSTASASYGISDDGTLVYARSWEATKERVLALVDRRGRVERLDVPPAPYQAPRISPDGRRIAVHTLEERPWRVWPPSKADVWIYELGGSRQIRQLTLDGDSVDPVWTPDSRRVTFTVVGRGAVDHDDLFWQAVDGGPAERLTTAGSETTHRPVSWSPAGPTLALEAWPPNDTDLWTLVPGAAPRPFEDLPDSAQRDPSFSPDGKWLAYTSTESGREELYLQPFPPTGFKVRVTQNGGCFPLWSPDGRELFYRRTFENAQLYRSTGVTLFSVAIDLEGGIAIGAERALPLEGFLVFNGFRDYDITPDGKRFVLVYPASGHPEPVRIAIVQGWSSELVERVPVR